MKTNQLQNAIKQVEAMKGRIIAMAPESTLLLHPDDYLYIVVAQFEHEFTVWGYNTEFDGLYNGFYTNDYADALNEFKRRIEK